MLKALWVAFLVIVWFFTLVMHSMVFQYDSFRGIAYLLGIFWLIYLAGLWFEQSRITQTPLGPCCWATRLV